MSQELEADATAVISLIRVVPFRPKSQTQHVPSCHFRMATRTMEAREGRQNQRTSAEQCDAYIISLTRQRRLW